MKRHGNLWDRIVSWDNMLLAYKKARKGKSKMRNVKRFALDWERNLRHIQRMLIDKTFTMSPYHVKHVYEPKFRQIYVLPFSPDRIVQHAAMNILEPIWDKFLVPQSYSCRIGKGVFAGHQHIARAIPKYKYCLKCDISKFYPSINHDIMYEIVQQKIKCPDTLWLLNDIIYSIGGGKNVPIGNYTSQWFANLYLDVLDRWAIHTLRIEYLRYCDDFVFLSNDKDKLNYIKDRLPKFLMYERKLVLSKNELFPTTRGVDFLGYRFFSNGCILLRKRTAKNIKRRMKWVRDKIYEGNDPLLYQSKVSSALGALRWCNSFHLRKSMKLSKLVKRTGIKTSFRI